MYAVPLWGNSYILYLSQLHILQKKAMRIITLSNHNFIKPPSSPLFKHLNCVTIYDIYKIETLKFVHDCINKKNPMHFHDYFNMNIATLNTANKRENKLIIPSVRTSTYGPKSLKYHGVILWNSLT